MCVHCTVDNCCTQYCTEQTWQFSLLPSRQSSLLRWCLFEERGWGRLDTHREGLTAWLYIQYMYVLHQCAIMHNQLHAVMQKYLLTCRGTISRPLALETRRPKVEIQRQHLHQNPAKCAATETFLECKNEKFSYYKRTARHWHDNTEVLLHKHTLNHFMALFPGLPGWAGARRNLLLDFTVQGR